MGHLLTPAPALPTVLLKLLRMHLSALPVTLLTVTEAALRLEMMAATLLMLRTVAMCRRRLWSTPPTLYVCPEVMEYSRNGPRLARLSRLLTLGPTIDTVRHSNLLYKSLGCGVVLCRIFEGCCR